MSSVESKIWRAKEHFAQVQNEIDAWLGEGSFTATYERNEDCDRHYLRAMLSGTPPPVERWALLFGDGMTNLRDSLDHLIYQISNGDVTKPLHPKASFVIVREELSFKAEAKNKLAGLSQTARSAVESFQPYRRPHPVAAPSLLGVLSDFAITNKHKLLLPVFTVPSSLRFNVVTQGPSKGRIGTTTGNIADGSIYFVYETDTPEQGTTLTFEKLEVDIALPHKTVASVPALLSGRSPTRFLVPAIIQEVEEAIKAIRTSL